MNNTPQDAYGQLKHLTSRAVELSRTGNLPELGSVLSKMEAAYSKLKRADPSLEIIQAAAREFQEGPLAIRVLAYSADTKILAAEAHLVAAENALKAGNMGAARDAYSLISEGKDLRPYLEAQCHKQHDLKTRVGVLDEKLKE